MASQVQLQGVYSHPVDRLVSSITRHKGNGGPATISDLEPRPVWRSRIPTRTERFPERFTNRSPFVDHPFCGGHPLSLSLNWDLYDWGKKTGRGARQRVLRLSPLFNNVVTLQLVQSKNYTLQFCGTVIWMRRDLSIGKLLMQNCCNTDCGYSFCCDLFTGWKEMFGRWILYLQFDGKASMRNLQFQGHIRLHCILLVKLFKGTTSRNLIILLKNGKKSFFII